jgi:hypothetical protein
MNSFFRRVATMEKEQEKADGGWVVRAFAALLPSAVAAIVVAYVTLQIVKVEVEKLIKSDGSQTEVLVKHTAEIAVLNERMVRSIEQLRDIAQAQAVRMLELERKLDAHREATGNGNGRR